MLYWQLNYAILTTTTTTTSRHDANIELPLTLIQEKEKTKNLPAADWARVLEAATQRRTEVLQPENLENMWTKGRNYKKKAQKNAAKGQNGNIKKDKDKIETSSSEKFPPRPHNTDLSNSLSLDGGFEGSSSKVKFRKSNSASDLIKETRVETGYAGQVSGSIISEFYSANVGRHDVPSVNVASDKVLRIEGCVPKLKCRVRILRNLG